MKRLWPRLGTLVFWLGWPVLYVYLGRSERTRILVVNGDKVLAVKLWLGTNEWNLPGGGLHRREAPVIGAMRELKEETGIRADPAHLRFLYKRRAKPEQGLMFTYYAFVLVLDSAPRLKLQRSEITQAAWINREELYNQTTNPNVKDVLTAWFKGLNLLQ